MACVLLYERPECGIRTVKIHPTYEAAMGELEAQYMAAMSKIDKTDPYFSEDDFYTCPPGKFNKVYYGRLAGAQIMYLDDIEEWYIYEGGGTDEV